MKKLFILALLFPAFIGAAEEKPYDNSLSVFYKFASKYGTDSTPNSLGRVQLKNNTQNVVYVDFFNKNDEHIGTATLDGNYGEHTDKYSSYEKGRDILHSEAPITMRAYIKNINNPYYGEPEDKEITLSDDVHAIPGNEYVIVESNEDADKTYKAWRFFEDENGNTAEKNFTLHLKKLAIVPVDNSSVNENKE